MSQQPIRIGLIGAGVWIKNSYVPTLQAQPENFRIASVYSRTLSSAHSVADMLGGDVRVTDDVETLLNDDTLAAVAIALPVGIMPDITQRALEAGKHVLSEKPIAGTVAQGKALLGAYAGRESQVWMIGEQWRYEDAFLKAAALIASQEIGEPRFAQWAVFNPFNRNSKYYQTTWRRDGSFPGGIVMDAFIHRVAGLRMTLGEVAQVMAVVRQQRADTPPADTLSATFLFENGVVGTVGATYNSPTRKIQPLTIVGSTGILEVDWHNLHIKRDDGGYAVPVEGGAGVAAQFNAFAHSIRTGEPHNSSAIEAVRDVATLEAALRSSDTGRLEAVEPIQG